MSFPLRLLCTALVTSAGSGCSYLPKAKLAPQPATALSPALAPRPTVEAPLQRPPIIPAVYKRYYVGLAPVGSGPSARFARAPGEFIVREAEEQWSSSGGVAGTVSGPTLGYRSSAFSPDPLPAEVQSALAQAANSIERLGEENVRLRHEVAAANRAALAAAVQSPPPAAPSPPAPPALTSPGPDTAPAQQAVQPTVANAPAALTLLSFNPSNENIIEVTSEFAAQSSGARRIPFEQVFFPSPTMVEAKFLVTVVVPGPESTAIINRKIYALGDLVSDGFVLLEVDEDGVWLRRSFFRVRIPYGEKPITVRFPQEV